jgi:putative transposase
MPNKEDKLIYFVEVKFQNKHEEGVDASEKTLVPGLAFSVCAAIARLEQSKSVKASAMKQKLKS